MKDNKGITLIALVITIIVLLILAGITIAMLTGENGILNNATKSKAVNELGAAKDMVSLTANEAVSDYFESVYVKSTNAKYSNEAVQQTVSAKIADINNLPAGVSMNTKPATGTAPDLTYSNQIELKYGDYGVKGIVTSNGSIKWGATVHTTNESTAYVYPTEN